MKNVYFLRKGSKLYKKGKYPVFFETVQLARKVKKDYEICVASLQDMVNWSVVAKLAIVISNQSQLKELL